MAKIKTYTVTKPVTDNHGNIYTILVYGEVREEKALDGIEVRRVRFRHGDNKVVDTNESLFYALGDNCSPSKSLNFGWAICNPNDEYDENVGIAICKKRFSKAPLKTQDCRFLKEDMVKAILNQTAEYVAENEFKAWLAKSEFNENFRNGEIVKVEYPAFYYFTALSEDENGEFRGAWLYSPSGFMFGGFEIHNKAEHVKKATDEEKASVQNYLRENFHNQWDENNAKFVKA